MDIGEELNKLSKLLFDMGKRNNLISFKDSKSSSVEVVYPDHMSLFSNLTNFTTLEVYEPKDKNKDEDTDPENLPQSKILKDEYIKKYSGDIKKKNQILIYTGNPDPLAVLRNIRRKSKVVIDETGVNIVYMAFGFIHWTESDNSSLELKAPILLVPMTIETKSFIDPIYIKGIEDDIIVNPNFAFKLKTEYGIDLPEFEEDENLDKYFTKIQNMLSKLHWRVSNECKIGTFSFSKINMYKDLQSNASKILSNDNVCMLLGKGDSMTNLDVDEDKAPILTNLHNVIDADSSQEEAIRLAKAGKSFVLQGPPGTGKSQTITNIIAESLNDGKKVLFVSEKMAALNVVYDKLKKVGLEEFCLELHSHKANKKQVVKELCHTLRCQRTRVSERAEKEIRAKENLVSRLDNYATKLHKVWPNINTSLYSIYEQISSCRHAPSVDFVIGNIEAKGEEYIENAMDVLNRYIEYEKYSGIYDYHDNIWYGYNDKDNSYEKSVNLKSKIKLFIEYITKLKMLNEERLSFYKIKSNTMDQSIILSKFFDLISSSKYLSPDLLNIENIMKSLDSICKLKVLSSEILKAKKYIGEFFNTDIYKLNGINGYKEILSHFNRIYKRILNKGYKKIVCDLRLCLLSPRRLPFKFVKEIFQKLSLYQLRLKSFIEEEGKIGGFLGSGYSGVNTDFEDMIKELNLALNVINKIPDTGILSHITHGEFDEKKKMIRNFNAEYYKLCNSYEDATKFILALFNLDEFDIPKLDLTRLTDKFDMCLKNMDKLDGWCEFLALKSRLESLGLMPFIDFCISQKLQNENISLTFKKAFYKEWADHIIHNSEDLLSFARIPHDLVVKQFKEKDKLIFEINKAIIKSKLSCQRPDMDMISGGSNVASLLHEGEKKRKVKSIRTLLSELGSLIQTLKPCFLMSPLSVSTFLSPDIKFDIVIFDEASQIFPQDAIGAIYRGKQLVVVGDSRQLPPTNFFNAIVQNNEENEDVGDFESILDLCSTSFVQKRLKWHYRSRYEELISFSNMNFYDNELITFPSLKATKNGIGVNYVYVNGTFDRKSKTNIEEAKKVVDLIFENIDKYPNRSLGVVAFSLSQQSLIESLLRKRRKQDPSKEEFFNSNNKNEPFFIKNLETVQGDERDSIIFSIAYGKGSDGRLLLNFGPLNRDGGERRLNVAITRAKYNVKIVTSMHYLDIDLSRTNSLGVKLLHDYLDYAENGTSALKRAITVNPFDRYDSDFEMEVCEFLREHGFSVDTQVGCSSFRIDMAVKEPNSSDYVLAIECDGATYHSSKNARDRDRLRQEVLEKMGWKFYRIWSTDWFRNRHDEEVQLITAVKEALSKIPTKDEKEVEPTIRTYEEIDLTKTFEFPKYVKANEKELFIKNQTSFLNFIKDIVKVESPLSEQWLLKRICFAFGRDKVTSRVKAYYIGQMRNCENYGMVRYNGFLYLKGSKIPMLRIPNENDIPREIKYIEINELANGLKVLIKQNLKAEKMGLFRLLTQKLGFSRMGDAITLRLEEALKTLSDQVIINGNMISLK